jgi:hypothetical protein
MRRAAVRVESRRDGQIVVRFEGQYLQVTLCQPAAKANIEPGKRAVRHKAPNAGGKSQWMAGFSLRSTPTLTEAMAISNCHQLRIQTESRANRARRSFALTCPRLPLRSFTKQSAQ